jgi:hypothetical protein
MCFVLVARDTIFNIYIKNAEILHILQIVNIKYNSYADQSIDSPCC